MPFKTLSMPLQAADVLIDDVTVSAAAKAIAQNLTTDDEVVVCLKLQNVVIWI